MPKATTTPTTPVAIGPASTRRQVLGGAVLAALTGGAFGAAIVLPNLGEAFPIEGIRVPQTLLQPSPDAELIALCAEFFRFNDASAAIPDDASFTVAMEARNTMVERISAMPAVSAAGLQAKARIGHFLMNERRSPGGSLDDVDSYGLALFRELLAGSVDPAPMPTSADAELLRLCAECDALQAKIDALFAVRVDHLSHAEECAMEKTRDIEQMPFLDAQDPLLERICELRATTPQGQAARARTLLGWDKDPCWVGAECWNDQLIGAIVRDAAQVA